MSDGRVLVWCSVVEFASSSDMKNAIEKLNDTELNGRNITVTEDRGRDSGGRRKRRWFTVRLVSFDS